MMVSSGAMWSESIKEGLLAHHPGMLLVDAFSSSEALGMGMSISGAGNAAATAKFTLGPDVKVLKDDGEQVTPGSDEIGVLALGGRNPLGYYKDEEKSARTFRVVDGVRYSIPGDFAQVDTDGTIHLLGSRFGLHQLGRREDLPRRGRRGAQDARGGARRRRGRHPAPGLWRTDRGGDRAGGREPRRRCDRHPLRPRSSPTSRSGSPATRPPAGCAWSTPSGAPPTARSTTGVIGPNRSRNSSPPT